GGEPKVAAMHLAILQQLGDHPLGRVDRYGEADALCETDNGRVDSDHAAATIHKRSTRVGGGQRHIRLDDIFYQTPRVTAQSAAQCRNDSGGYLTLEAEGISDGDDQLSGA